ncbi:VOC family protein [Dactylosporangium sp. NPDC048998]|uniref:VOC family protein n=1 Tax=Dactylosporangium sp. NPDC048998 TaxID=3363976 RepID=UPI00372158DB
MTTEWQLAIDCADPDRLVPFWARALGYVPAEPPAGHASWREYYLSIGVPEAELGGGDAVDRLVDPTGRGPAIWFQVVPEGKSVKNRLHLDLKVGGGQAVPLPERRRRVDAKAAELVASGATIVRVNESTEPEHYAVLMGDPEGNEFCVV